MANTESEESSVCAKKECNDRATVKLQHPLCDGTSMGVCTKHVPNECSDCGGHIIGRESVIVKSESRQRSHRDDVCPKCGHAGSDHTSIESGPEHGNVSVLFCEGTDDCICDYNGSFDV